jgi:hypothetical protein
VVEAVLLALAPRDVTDLVSTNDMSSESPYIVLVDSTTANYYIDKRNGIM